jgi:hypothetical protein
MIETAPRDGKLVVVEEDAATGKYDVAHWSPEADRWVGENGEPINITPKYWYPMPGLQQGLDFPFFLRRVAEQRGTASDVVASAGAQTTLVEAKRASQAWWRFAASLISAILVAAAPLVEAKRASQERWRFAASLIAGILVAAALTGMYFRAEVAYEAGVRRTTDAMATELQQERDHRAALANELASVRRDFDAMMAPPSKAGDEAAQLRKAAEAKAAELRQERDHSAALANELATVRRDFDAMVAALLSKAGDEAAQLRKAAEAKAAELQQERDHTAALQSRTPAAAEQVAAPPARKLPSRRELATLMNRAKRLIAAGDISPGRLLLERAAEAQEPTAALKLARTYDPDVLGTQKIRNIVPDLAMARVWYQRAAQLGSADAQRRLDQLQATVSPAQ